MDNQVIGDLLKSRRMAQGLSIQNVADRTKMKISYIESMERGDFSVFEAQIYIRNFVRTYARFLRIDSAEIMALLDAGQQTPDTQAGDGDTAPESLQEIPSTMGQSAKQSVSSSAMVFLAAAVVIGGGIFLFQSYVPGTTVSAPPNPMEPEVQSPETLPGAVPADSAPMTDTLGPAVPAEIPAASKSRAVQLRALEDVWVFWEADGRGIEKILGAGEVQKISFAQILRLRIGNSSGLKLEVDGREFKINGGDRVFDKIFKVKDDGSLSVETTGARDMRRFRSRFQMEENP